MTSTFAEINSLDWSSMITDSLQQQQQQPRSTLKQELQQPSPISDNDGENVWFNKLLADDQISSTTTTTTTNASTTGSPLEFSSLFDVDENAPSEPQSLFSSNATSLDNSPLIKTEDTNNIEVPQFDLTQTDIQRMDSTTSISSNDSNSEVKKPKKKRAPRKRLTPHQKQAHNKIEKRYRININTKIAGLQQIIPWVASEQTAFETGEGCKIDPDADVPRLNKSMILEKATSYILFLQEGEVKMKSQLEKLRKEVERLGGDPNIE